MLESEWQRMVQVELVHLGFRLFRNTVGYDREKKQHYGLSKGSPDLVGWLTVDVTGPEWMGKHDLLGRPWPGSKIAVFVGVEVKMPRTATTDRQRKWLEIIDQAGGFQAIARAPSKEPTREDAQRVAKEIHAACLTKYGLTPTP